MAKKRKSKKSIQAEIDELIWRLNEERSQVEQRQREVEQLRSKNEELQRELARLDRNGRV